MRLNGDAIRLLIESEKADTYVNEFKKTLDLRDSSQIFEF